MLCLESVKNFVTLLYPNTSKFFSNKHQIQEVIMIYVEERDDVSPICPHCEKEIKKVFVKKLESTFGVRFMYMCSSCRKTLGVTHRKGFWMG